MWSPRFRFSITVFAVAIVLFCDVLATPVHEVDPNALIAGADLIVLGRVLSVTKGEKTIANVEGNSIPAIRATAVLKVDGLIKGEAHGDSLSLTYYSPDSPSILQDISVGQYGMFFVRSSTEGLSFYDPVYPYLPAVPGSYGQSTPLDRATAVLGEVASSRGESDAHRLEAVELLAKLRTNTAKEALERTMSSETGEFRLHVAAALVSSNNIAGLPTLADALLHPRDLSPGLLQYLAGSLGGMRDARAVPTLARLVTMPEPQTRMGVAMALRQSRTAAALKPLSKFLNDSNLLVTYYAVVGMGEITRQDEWTPSFETFQHNPAPFLKHWQEWANTNNLGDVSLTR
jgi:hypothetical protein